MNRMTISKTRQDRPERVPANRAFQAGLLGGALAAAGNLIIYLVAQSLLGIEMVAPIGAGGSLVPLTPLNIVLTSFIPGVAAGILLWLLGRYFANPMQVFFGVALSILLFSFTLPLGIASIPNDVRVIMAIMHIVAAGTIAGVIAYFND